jgi:hypothetical protein
VPEDERPPAAAEPVTPEAASADGEGAVRGVPTALKIAAALIGLQAVGLLVGGVVLLIDSLTGHPTDRASALLAAAFAALGAVALAFGARGLLRLRPAARTPVVVLEILAVPVAYQLAFDSDRPEWGGPILVCALAVLYLLFTPPVRAVLDRGDR